MANSDEQKIIELLEKLPQVEDKTNKEQLYEKISLHIPKKSGKFGKGYKPFLIVALFFLLLLSVPLLLNESLLQQITLKNDSVGDEELFMTAKEGSSDQSIEYAEEAATSIEKDAPVNLYESSVLYSVSQDTELIDFTIIKHSKDYIFPLVMIIPSEKQADDYLVQLNKLLYSSNLMEEGDVLEERSAFGEKASYLLYKNEYYAHVTQEGDSGIADALLALKASFPEDDLKNTIVPSAKFTVRESDELLIIKFESGTINEQDITTVMIESILLTAKSYGFSEVSFEKIPIEEIGPYNLTSPIPVPIAANPFIGQ